VQKAQQDPEGSSFPWQPQTIFEMLNGNLENNKGEKLDAVSHLKGMTAFGIYFSAHWCGPCKAFTPKFVETYKALQARGQKFEVVFASSDKSPTEFQHYFETMPWTAIPFSDTRISVLNDYFNVEGIPHLVILDGPTGRVITDKARMRIMADTEGKEFPWYPKALSSVDEAVMDINDRTCFMYFDPNMSQEQVQVLEKIATDYGNKWKTMPESPLLFMHGKNSDATTKVKKFANLPDKCVFVLSIPDGQKTVYDGSDYSDTALRSFIESYLAKSLTPKGIKE